MVMPKTQQEYQELAIFLQSIHIYPDFEIWLGAQLGRDGIFYWLDGTPGHLQSGTVLGEKHSGFNLTDNKSTYPWNGPKQCLSVHKQHADGTFKFFDRCCSEHLCYIVCQPKGRS